VDVDGHRRAHVSRAPPRVRSGHARGSDRRLRQHGGDHGAHDVRLERRARAQRLDHEAGVSDFTRRRKIARSRRDSPPVDRSYFVRVYQQHGRGERVDAGRDPRRSTLQVQPVEDSPAALLHGDHRRNVHPARDVDKPARRCARGFPRRRTLQCLRIPPSRRDTSRNRSGVLLLLPAEVPTFADDHLQPDAQIPHRWLPDGAPRPRGLQAHRQDRARRAAGGALPPQRARDHPRQAEDLGATLHCRLGTSCSFEPASKRSSRSASATAS